MFSKQPDPDFDYMSEAQREAAIQEAAQGTLRDATNLLRVYAARTTDEWEEAARAYWYKEWPR